MAVKLILLLAMIAGAAVALYGLFVDKSGQAIAFSAAGLTVLGVALAIAGFLLGTSAVSSGRAGRGGRALAWAFLGGLFVLGAAGSLALATVLAVIVLF
jgi:hypothetical protein